MLLMKTCVGLLLVGCAANAQHVKTFFDAPNARYSTEYQVDHQQRTTSLNNRPVASFRTIETTQHALPKVTTFTPVSHVQPVHHQVYHTHHTTQVQNKFDLPAPPPVTYTQKAYVAPVVTPVHVQQAPIRIQQVSAPIRVQQIPAAVRVQQISAPIRATAYERQVENYPRTPYSFDYSVNDAEGTHGRKESGDANGRVVGQYDIVLADGRKRTVHYEADHNGYRARIETNEFGTESQSPADVFLYSSAIPAKEASLQYERQRYI